MPTMHLVPNVVYILFTKYFTITFYLCMELARRGGVRNQSVIGLRRDHVLRDDPDLHLSMMVARVVSALLPKIKILLPQIHLGGKG